MTGINKILLMYPNSKWTEWINRTVWDIHPYNLGLLAACMDKKYEVKIIDGNADNLSKEDFSDIIAAEKPDILGISVLTNEYARAGHIASQIAKDAYPNIITVMGGIYTIATSPSDILSDKNVDYVVVGEGEYVFGDLCSYLDGRGNLPNKGIAYKKDSRIINTGRADFIEDLDNIPYPAYNKVDFMRYATKIQREDITRPRDLPYARIQTSRGCPYNCCFCEVGSISGKKPRYRGLDNILGEIEWLMKDYGIRSLIFDDDNLLTNERRAKDLFRSMIERKYNLSWVIPALAVNRLDEEMVALMKESGCKLINISIESGVEKVLKEIIHKPVKLEHAKQMIGKIKDYGIDLIANFVFGFPGERWEDIRRTVKFAEEIDVDYVKLFIATPLSSNTELYKKAKEGNCLVEGFHFNQHLWTDGWIRTTEFRPQDLKILRAYEWDRINFSNSNKRKKIARMMGISEERLNEIRKETLERANP